MAFSFFGFLHGGLLEWGGLIREGMSKCSLNKLRFDATYTDHIYTGTDPNGSVSVWVQIGFPLTLDLLDPHRYESAIRTNFGSFSKVYQLDLFQLRSSVNDRILFKLV